MTDKLAAYKAFDEGMTCRGVQYEVGKTYEHKGNISLCNSGFHGCELPFDCWAYYPQSLTFAKVTLEGVSEKKDNDSKRVAGKITIEARLSLPEWIKHQVHAIVEMCKTAAASITSEDKTNAATTGDWANAATTGNGANAATTGNGANAATTGYRANAATTGDWANAATTGDWANAATTGNGANAATTGKNTIAACLGTNSQAKAGENGCIVLTYWDEKAGRPRVVVGYVGKRGLKADTWYCVTNKGKFKEVK